MKNMLLKGLKKINGLYDTDLAIQIHGEKIEKVYSHAPPLERNKIEFENAFVLPGLINSHDHLCLNLHPRLGESNYADYKEWARDVQSNYQEEIQILKRVPKELLYKWGILKNLVNGITTVVQHGPFYQTDFDHLLKVHSRSYPLHSVSFEPNWKLKILIPTFLPIVMHLGEGVNEEMEQELKLVNRWNIFRNQIILVHGIKLRPELAKKFKALIWCPESNIELYQATADVRNLKSNIPVLFGTDSTISSTWNMWEHFQRVYQSDLLPDNQLLATLTTNPSKVWKFSKVGHLKEGYSADLIILENTSGQVWDNTPASVLLVIKSGKIVLCDDRIWPQASEIVDDNSIYQKLLIMNTWKWIPANIEQLMQEIQDLAPQVIFPFGL